MKISELPKKDRKKALEYQRNCNNNYCDKDTDELLWAFSWRATIEGYKYWEYLHHQEKKESDKIIIFILIFAIITLLIFIL